MIDTVSTPSKHCSQHGEHCWHILTTLHTDDGVKYTRNCCWCGEMWVEEIRYAKRAGWCHNPDAHPEHGAYQSSVTNFALGSGTEKGTKGRLYG